MWLIDRQSDGLGTARIPLPVPLRAALVRWYIGEGSRHDEEAGITLVQQARIGSKWIACGCLGSDHPPPILTPAFLAEAETYYLRRLTSPKRPEHDANCPFFRDQATNRITETRSAQTPADPLGGYFEALRPAPEKLAQRPETDASDDRTRGASVPRLARLLWRLITGASLNIAVPSHEDSSQRTIGDEFKLLSCAAAKFEVAPGIELDRVLWTHGGALHSRRAFAAIRELSHRWPHGHAPQGFLAVFAKSFRGQTIYPAGSEPISVANRVQSPSVRTDPVTGPYLVLVVLGEYTEKHGYAPLRAYAQPVYSGLRFMPVDSDFERSVVRALLGCRYEFRRRGIDLAFEKPVFDILTSSGPCRPDFLIEARSRLTGEIRQIAVEAVGASVVGAPSDPTRSRSLEQIAPVMPVTPAIVESGGLGPLLWEVLR